MDSLTVTSILFWLEFCAVIIMLLITIQNYRGFRRARKTTDSYRRVLYNLRLYLKGEDNYSGDTDACAAIDRVLEEYP